jgi:hypothetical protein
MGLWTPGASETLSNHLSGRPSASRPASVRWSLASPPHALAVVLGAVDGALDGRSTLAQVRLAALNFALDSMSRGKIEPLSEKFGFGICG